MFLCDSGSVSVEVAMKMALQYWSVTGSPERQRFLTVRNGYHGDTLHAMSVCDPTTGMHRLFPGALPQQLFADAPPMGFDRPWCETDIDSFARLLRENADTPCRRDPGTDRPGRWRDAILLANIPAARAGTDPRRGHPADPGRDRHRIRAHRTDVCRRTCGCQSRHSVCRKGAYRRLSDARCHDRDTCGGRACER